MSYFWQETGLSSSPTIPYQEGMGIEVYHPVKDGDLVPYSALLEVYAMLCIVLGSIFYKKSLET